MKLIYLLCLLIATELYSSENAKVKKEKRKSCSDENYIIKKKFAFHFKESGCFFCCETRREFEIDINFITSRKKLKELIINKLSLHYNKFNLQNLIYILTKKEDNRKIMERSDFEDTNLFDITDCNISVYKLNND